jgi:hypothetical protein
MVTIHIIVLLIVGLVKDSQSCDYYVASAGSDSNDGKSPNTPWATLQKVSSMAFNAGDSVCFKSGDTFKGQLTIQSQAPATTPISFNIYEGNSSATIVASSDQSAVYIYNACGIELRNLILMGAGPLVAQKPGLLAYVDVLNGTKLEHIVIENVEVSGFVVGVSISAWQTPIQKDYCGYKDVLIQSVYAHDNRDCGICTSGIYDYPPTPQMSHKNIVVSNCVASNNKGNPNNKNGNTGNGIILSGTDGGLIELSVAHDNGELNSHLAGGPYGIWTYYANAVIIQYNIAYNNKNGGTKTDGGGFDIDGGSTNCVIQYNYSYDNEGASYLLAQFDGASAYNNNTIRYNIGQNDTLNAGMGSIHLWSSGSSGGITNSYIYGNTIYVDAQLPLVFQAGGAMENIYIYDNIFIGSNDIVELQEGIKNLQMIGNSYWSSGQWSIKWQKKVYNTLDEFRSATGNEMFQNQPMGFSDKPTLINAGGGYKCTDPKQLQMLLQAYALTSNSPLSQGGLPSSYLNSLRAGVDPGPVDFFGKPIPTNSRLSGAY